LTYSEGAGANWIYTFGPGYGSHPILRLQKRQRQDLTCGITRITFITQDTRIEQGRGDELMDLVQTIFDEAFAQSAQHKYSIPIQKSMYNFVAPKAKQIAIEH
jgi:hypothetical protein